MKNQVNYSYLEYFCLQTLRRLKTKVFSLKMISNFFNLTDQLSTSEANLIQTCKKVQSIPSLMMNNIILNANNNTLQQKIIITCFNLHPKMFNCDKLFNFLCLYGNVERVNKNSISIIYKLIIFRLKID